MLLSKLKRLKGLAVPIPTFWEIYTAVVEALNISVAPAIKESWSAPNLPIPVLLSPLKA